jgi:hypothetical protein
MHRVTITVLDPPTPDAERWLLFPRPLEAGMQHLQGMRLSGFSELREVEAVNSAQRAYVGRATAEPPEICFDLAFNGDAPAAWVYRHDENRYTRASVDLAAESARLVGDAGDGATRIERLVTHTAKLFEYDHPERRFNDGTDEMPMLCGPTLGSCVDMHGYLVAAARSVGLSVQYLAGYWFGPGREETHDFHCWLVFDHGGRPLFWDLAHHLKWGVRPLAPGLNPAGGRRVLMSYGRGNRFGTPVGEVELSHFSEPVWLSDGGAESRPKLRIRVAGPSSQFSES